MHKLKSMKSRLELQTLKLNLQAWPQTCVIKAGNTFIRHVNTGLSQDFYHFIHVSCYIFFISCFLFSCYSSKKKVAHCVLLQKTNRLCITESGFCNLSLLVFRPIRIPPLLQRGPATRPGHDPRIITQWWLFLPKLSDDYIT